MLLLLPAAMLLFHVKHFELFCTLNVLYTHKFDLTYRIPFKSRRHNVFLNQYIKERTTGNKDTKT